MNVSQISQMMTEAQTAAYEAASEFENKYFPNNGWGMCGFAWVNLYEYQ